MEPPATLSRTIGNSVWSSDCRRDHADYLPRSSPSVSIFSGSRSQF